MTIKARTGGTLRTASSIKVRVAGVLRPVQSIRIKHGGALRTVFLAGSPLSVSISPASINQFGAGATLGATAVAIVSGGVGPYSYSWSKLSGDSNIDIENSSIATGDFIATDLTIFEPVGAAYQVSVTDALGGTGSDTINMIFTRTA